MIVKSHKNAYNVVKLLIMNHIFFSTNYTTGTHCACAWTSVFNSFSSRNCYNTCMRFFDEIKPKNQRFHSFSSDSFYLVTHHLETLTNVVIRVQGKKTQPHYKIHLENEIPFIWMYKQISIFSFILFIENCVLFSSLALFISSIFLCDSYIP